MLIEEKDISDWRSDIQDYNRQRKERGFENPKVERISQKTIKDKEKIFDPLLQVFNDPNQDADDFKKSNTKLMVAKQKKNKNLEKYVKDFNIVNLEKLDVNIIPEKTYTKSIIKPSVREFNIITNSALEKYMYENVKVLKQEKVVEKKTDLSKIRDFNIISNKYTDNHETKTQHDDDKVKNTLDEKYRKTHKYNFVNGICYDPEMEKQYQDKLKETNQNHGKDAILKLPPSLRYRETVIFDRNKPIPEELKLIDQQRENAKKRYKLRYAVENEYHERNIETQDRRQQRLLNGLCDQKYLDEHRKGFDIITLDKINIHDIEQLINKKPNLTSWDKVQLTKKDEFANTTGVTKSSFHGGNNNNNNHEDITYYNEGRYENAEQTPNNQRQQQQQQQQNNNYQNDKENDYENLQNYGNLRTTEPGRINLPKISSSNGYNDNNNDRQEIFSQSQQNNLRGQQQYSSGGDQPLSQQNEFNQQSKPPRQNRRQQTGQKLQQQFEENTYNTQPKSQSNLEKSSRGSIISTESNQNKFRIKTGGFNA